MNNRISVGITERGDAGINLAWLNKINTVNGMVLITKDLTETFVYNVLDLHKKGYKIIVHCTCTGYGGSALEPCVPNYQVQLNALKTLIDMGFPADHCVLRIDPIFPSEKGLNKVREVMNYFMSLNTNVERIRVSIVDEYPHVRERYAKRGWNPLYNGNFGPSSAQIQAVASLLQSYCPYTFETCAEESLCNYANNCIIQGCISNADLHIMGLLQVSMPENPQNRKGCHCLSCKTELLTERKPCPNGCVYCFWKGV